MSKLMRLGFVAALMVLTVGAGSSIAGPPQKTGSAVTLSLAVPEERGRPSSDIAEVFASRVKALSKGSLVVTIAYSSGLTRGAETPVGVQEANLIGLVRTGKSPLAIIPTRAFDAQGVSSFQALQAPFLITTEAAMDRVTTGSIADRLESGLPNLGLTGLGLAPEGLRRPFGFEQPLVSPDDFAGITFRAIQSRLLWSLIRALGARPVDINGHVMDQAVRDGSVKGADASLALAAAGSIPAPGFTAGNLAFFPKVDALVGNGGALNGLSPAQVSLLRQAAASARAWAVAALTERKGRDAYCKAGGTVVIAPASSIAELRAKAAPVLAAMQADPLTRTLIAEIGRSGASGSAVRACAHGPSGEAASGPTVDTVIPAGVYRKTVTEQQLLAAGASASDAKTNGGTWTLTVTADGYQSIHIDSPYPEKTVTCARRRMYLASTGGPQKVDRNGLVAIQLAGAGCGGGFGVAWKLVPGGIAFTRVSSQDPVLRSFWSGVVWKRVG